MVVVVVLTGGGVVELVDEVVGKVERAGAKVDELVDDAASYDEVTGELVTALSVSLAHPANATAARTQVMRRTRPACRWNTAASRRSQPYGNVAGPSG
jgi:hypothetical protein